MPDRNLVTDPGLRAVAGDFPRDGGFGDALALGPRGLELDGVPLADVARAHGTPLYVYGAATLRRRLAELRAALASTGVPFRIHYAMRGCRFAPVLDLVRQERDVGIDACSPREVERAIAAGFTPAEISVTASMLSNRDLRQLAGRGVHLNLDTRSALRRWGAICGPGRAVGLSVAGGAGGFGPDAALAAAAHASTLGLEVDQLHLDAGGAPQASAAPLLAAAFAQLAALARAIPTVRTLHVGGGLCWRRRPVTMGPRAAPDPGLQPSPEDEPLLPAVWAELLREHLAPTGCSLACDPGAFFAASSRVLLADGYARAASDPRLRSSPAEVLV